MNRPRVRPMTPGISHAARLRAYLAAAVVTAGFLGVAWRAWGLQVTDSEHYRTLAARQHALFVEIPAPRGDIVDVRGRPLAVTADADSIWANPREIRDVTETAAKLAALIGGEPAALEAKLAGARRFVWLGRHVTPALARKVREARLPGIEVAKEPRRWYPGRAIGGTVIGRSDVDGRGVDGIELAMNAQLSGHRGEGVALRDARGKRMFADGLERPEAGATIQLSLDSTIQAIAESAIAESVHIHKAKSGVVVAIDIATGRVVAMASAPSYDPNGGAAAATGERREPARNRGVTDAYEAGSVMKIFSVAAALDDGTVAPDTGFDLSGGQFRIVPGVKPIRDVHDDPYLTVAGIIKRSSNIGSAKIALRFGSAKLYAALRRFGFGARTGVELPGEQAGALRDGARWRDIDLAHISFGYGLTVTPLQVTAALAAFGNRGIYREPRIVERVTDSDGTVLYEPLVTERRVVSERTAAQMMAMLASVFERGKQPGTAWQIVVPGFRCGGKTGTAHKYDPAIHGYALDHYLSSFAGLAPIDHPRLAIFVLVDDPSGGDYFGGTVAGPVFARVASEALRYLGVPGEPVVCDKAAPAAPTTEPRTCLPAPPGPVPGRVASAGPATAAPVRGDGPAPRDDARAAVPPGEASAPPAIVSLAAGEPLEDAAAPGGAMTIGGAATASLGLAANPSAPVASGAGTTAITPAGGASARDASPRELPDFRGMGLSRALAAAQQAHVAVAISGTGRVVEQRPAPGSRAASQVWLRLSDGRTELAPTGARPR